MGEGWVLVIRYVITVNFSASWNESSLVLVVLVLVVLMVQWGADVEAGFRLNQPLRSF